MENLTGKIRQLNNIFKRAATNFMPLDELCNELCQILECNIYLFHADGEVLSFSTSTSCYCRFNADDLRGTKMPQRYMGIFESVDDAVFNSYEKEPFCTYHKENMCIYNDRYYTLMPIYYNFRKVAGMLLIRYGIPFTEDEKVLCEYTSGIVALEMMRREQEKVEQKATAIVRCQLASRSLSYTEIKSTAAFLDELKGDEGIIVLSSISNKIYVTRSIITSALRKLESAGTIKTKSLGVKGTHIIIKNPYLRDEIKQVQQQYLDRE